ncbi:hypothetical protein [Pseudomonas sp. Irchel s3b2]|uniref:hypothetical protein n=1 Tax=Pseudomonas sp. Irchel s3b2 TaxID=2009073 RepID=UPI00113FFF4F|nr:hypothetical protein [Pseudomonas sp. Irchel s3b2]
MELNRETRQKDQSSTVETRLLATDQQGSVLNVVAAEEANPQACTPYAHRHPGNGLLSLLGFNGEPQAQLAPFTSVPRSLNSNISATRNSTSIIDNNASGFG